MRAVVPAYNEAMTVGAVVDALLRSDCFEEVVVVDDGSIDDTRAIARDMGARVVSTPRNLGKGGAMLQAVQQRCAADSHVAFFDADLVGLQPAHVHQMVTASNQGYDMVCGMIGIYGMRGNSVLNALQLAFSPIITGQRVLAHWVINALPQTCWSGYSIETAMNHVVTSKGGRTALVLLDGVAMRTKSEKTGLLRGITDHLKMARQIVATRRALRKSGGLSCR